MISFILTSTFLVIYYQCVEDHFELWEIKRKIRPRAKAPPIIPDLYPIPSVDDYLIDPDYPVEASLQATNPSRSRGELYQKLP
jgi:hypothetical protein